MAYPHERMIKVTTLLGEHGMIVQETDYGLDEGASPFRLADDFHRQVLKIQEQGVRDALIKLGWSPPGLLAKYMAHVRGCEGIDFVDRLNDGQGSDEVFTPAEKKTLEELAANQIAERERKHAEWLAGKRLNDV